MEERLAGRRAFPEFRPKLANLWVTTGAREGVLAIDHPGRTDQKARLASRARMALSSLTIASASLAWMAGHCSMGDL
jgi:hypothetical protein